MSIMKTFQISSNNLTNVCADLARGQTGPRFGRGEDTVGNPHRAQISQFELFRLILLLKLDKRFPVEQFEACRAIRGSSISVSSTLPPS